MREMHFSICAEIINHTTADIILTSFFGFSTTLRGIFVLQLPLAIMNLVIMNFLL